MELSKRSFIFLGILISVVILAFPVFAIKNFDVEYKTVSNSITIGERAYFNVTVRNKREYAESYELFSPVSEWEVRTDPDIDKRIELPSYSQKKVRVYVSPKGVLAAGDYGIQLNVKARVSNELEVVFLPVFLNEIEERQLEYKAAIRSEIDVPKRTDPRQKLEIKVRIENRNLKDIDELVVKVAGDNINLQTVTSLGPLKEKTLVFTPEINPYDPPRKENIVITTSVDDKQLTRNFETIEIIGYSQLTGSEKKKKGFLSSEKTIDLVNDGNIPLERPYYVETTAWRKIFSKTRPLAALTEMDDVDYFEFDVSLKPEESQKIVITENYRPLFYLVVLVVAVIVLYYFMRSPIVIIKSISGVKTKDGAISELKVLLVLKNRTGRQYDDIVVLDRLPHITHLVNEFAVGMLKPTKVLVSEKRGTIVRWELDNIEGYEERVLTYKIRTRMEILGGLSLPLAILKYRNLRGEHVSLKSNKLRILLGPEEHRAR